MDNRKEIYDKTWAGDYWGPQGALTKAKKAYNEKKEGDSGAAHCAFASSCYSASGNAFAKVVQTTNKLKKMFWRFRAIKYGLKAVRLYFKHKKESGLESMSPAQLSVYASILVQAGSRIPLLNNRLPHEALACVNEALDREIYLIDSKFSDGDRLLLLVAKAEALEAIGSLFADSAYNDAYELVEKVPPTASVRFYKSYAMYLKKFRTNVEQQYFEKALKIAEDNGFTDQIEKIRAVM